MKKISMLAMVGLLAACGSGEVRQTLGLNRDAPDEFKVVSRPPLSVPPDFFLRPPAPGEPPRVSGSSEDEAARLLLNREKSDGLDLRLDLDDAPRSDVDTAIDPVVSGSLETTGESIFLQNAGAENADESIRKIIHEDTKIAPLEQEQEYGLQQWLGLAGDGESVVDPKAEAERIRGNIDDGKPVNEGDVKTIDDASKSTLDRLFE